MGILSKTTLSQRLEHLRRVCVGTVLKTTLSLRLEHRRYVCMGTVLTATLSLRLEHIRGVCMGVSAFNFVWEHVKGYIISAFRTP